METGGFMTNPARVAARPWWAAPPRGGDSSRARAFEELSSAGRVPYAALVAFTFCLLIAPQSLFPALASLHLAFVAAGVAIATFLLDRFTRQRPLGLTDPEAKYTIFLLAWALVTVPVSYWPSGSLSNLLGLLLKAAVIFVLLANVVDTPRRLRGIVLALCLFSIPLSVAAMRHYMAGDFVAASAKAQVTRIVGYEAPLTTNPNDLALMLNLIIPLCVSLFIITRHKGGRFILGVAALLAALAVIFTFSRGGFLTLAVTSVLHMRRLLRGGRSGWAFVAAVACLAALTFLPSAYLGHLRSITDIQSDTTGSAQERLGDMISAASFVATHPILGAGVGMSALALNEVRGAAWRVVHNVYLEYAVDLGLPGLALFLLLFRAAYKRTKAASSDTGGTGDGEVSVLAEGIKISLVAFAVAGLFHPVSYNFYFYYIAGLAVAAGKIAAREAATRMAS